MAAAVDSFQFCSAGAQEHLTLAVMVLGRFLGFHVTSLSPASVGSGEGEQLVSDQLLYKQGARAESGGDR